MIQSQTDGSDKSTRRAGWTPRNHIDEIKTRKSLLLLAVKDLHFPLLAINDLLTLLFPLLTLKLPIDLFPRVFSSSLRSKLDLIMKRKNKKENKTFKPNSPMLLFLNSIVLIFLHYPSRHEWVSEHFLRWLEFDRHGRTGEFIAICIALSYPWFDGALALFVY